MYTLQQINSFIRIAEAGSFAKAAEELFVSSTALIQQLNLLEKSLGFKLFKRTKQGVALTEAGRFFYNEMRDVLVSIDNIVSRGKAIASKRENQITIGYTYWHPSAVASRLVALCVQHNLNYPINTLLVNWEDLVPEVEKGELDAGIIWENRSLRAPGLKYLVLEEKPLLLGIPLTNPLKEKYQISLEDLNGQKIVLPPEGTFDMTDQFRERLDEKGIRYELITEPKNIESTIQCVKNNACRISTDVINVENSQLLYRPLLTDILYRICLVYREENENRLKDIVEIGSRYYLGLLQFHIE